MWFQEYRRIVRGCLAWHSTSWLILGSARLQCCLRRCCFWKWTRICGMHTQLDTHFQILSMEFLYGNPNANAAFRTQHGICVVDIWRDIEYLSSSKSLLHAFVSSKSRHILLGGISITKCHQNLAIIFSWRENDYKIYSKSRHNFFLTEKRLWNVLEISS